MQDEPNNQSPDTISENDEPVTVGEVADAVVEKLKGLIPGIGAAAGSNDGGTAHGGGTAEPIGTGPANTGSNPVPNPPPPPPPPASVSAGQDVESTVRRVLAEKDTDNRIAAVETKVNTPPEPKPERKGIAAAIFGKTRP